MALGIGLSRWYYRPIKSKPKVRQQRAAPIAADLKTEITDVAEANPWYGYKRIAVMCRRRGVKASDRVVYRVMRDGGLLQRKRPKRVAEMHQTAKLVELLPSGPNELWQMDVTYIHIPGHGWWYAVTVIDYSSRYLLGLRLSWSYSAREVIAALREARIEAERVHGPLVKQPFLVTDNGTSFLAKRFADFVRDDYAHVRIQYRTPSQLGLLERFHQTLKREEVYWRLYDSPEHARQSLGEFHQRYNHDRPHWALIPDAGGDPYTPAEVYEAGQTTQLPRWQSWATEAKKKLDHLMQQDAA